MIADETLRALCSPDELERMQHSIKLEGEIPDLTYIVEDPPRLSARFIAANERKHGMKLLEAVTLPDGWVRCAYRMPWPQPQRKAS